MKSDQEIHERLMKEERRKNRRIILTILAFHGTVNLILIIIFIDSSLEELLSILGVYNFLFPLVFMIFLVIGGQTTAIGPVGALGYATGIVTELIHERSIDEERRKNRIEALKAIGNDFYFFFLLMIFGCILVTLAWLV